MHPLLSMKFGEGPIWTPELLLALKLLGGLFLLLLIGLLVLRYQKRSSSYHHFLHLMDGRGFDGAALRCLFRYLYRRHLKLELILESEAVARHALKHCGIDEEEGLRKLGFDTHDLIKKFLDRQRELRKKWNAH